jgi:hypothetical protein
VHFIDSPFEEWFSYGGTEKARSERVHGQNVPHLFRRAKIVV